MVFEYIASQQTRGKWRQERGNLSVAERSADHSRSHSTNAVEYWSSDAIETWSRRLSTRGIDENIAR